MKYGITSRNGISGALLVIRFPYEDVDEKALRTIQNDTPDFLVPFTFRIIDEEAECTYQLGSRTKLQYRFGERTPDQYIEFWTGILSPLLECGDWFLKPYSFLLDTNYLFADKDGKTISYIYVPSKQDVVDINALQELAVKVSNQNGVTDQALENKVLRAVMQDFRPNDFLQMLRESLPRQNVPTPAYSRSVERGQPLQSVGGAFEGREEKDNIDKGQHEVEFDTGKAVNGNLTDDIVINVKGADRKGKNPKKTKKEEKNSSNKQKGGGLFSGLRKSKEKQTKSPNATSKGKGEYAQEIIAGAAAEMHYEYDRHDDVGLIYQKEDENIGVTQIDESSGKTGFHLVGDASLPHEIMVNIVSGQSFTIGRFDVTLGRKQSNFEFDAKTKAISRHHAAIERDINGAFSIVDIGSQAGTFLDGKRLQTGVAHQLYNGARVSFGTAGADYVWEEAE